MKQLKVILEDRLADLLEYQTIKKRDFVPLVLADIAQDKDTPAKPQHGREPDKVKPLAQYLDEYIEHEIELGNIEEFATAGHAIFLGNSWAWLLEQAFDAYESTEQVKIKIEKV